MDGKNAIVDRAVARIAERQHGVIAIGQLRAAGVSEDAVRGRVRSGRLHRVHRGVYAVGYPAVSHEGRWMAVILACGHGELGGGAVLDHWGAALSHRSAACLWELLSWADEPSDVTVPGDGGRSRRRGIRLHRSILLRPADVTLHRGIPVTTPGRTIADLRRVVSESGGRGLLTPGELRRATRQANVLGRPIVEEADRDRSRSDLERDFFALCRYTVIRLSEKQVDEEPDRVAEVLRIAVVAAT